MVKKLINSQSGLAALLLVVIIGAVGLIAVRTAAKQGLKEIDLAFIGSQGHEALAIANACAEEILRRWQIDSNYSADNKTIVIGGGECLYSAVINGQERIVSIKASKGNYYKRIQLAATQEDDYISLDTWQEVSE